MTSFSLTSRLSARRAVVTSKPCCSRSLALLAQVEEQLALGLGGADLHQAPVVQDELEHVGADPVRRVARQLDAPVRVVLGHGLHQPDVALLHQVEQVAMRPTVLVRDLDHQAQVGLDQLARGLGVAVLDQPDRQGVLFLGRQQRKAPGLVHVRGQRVAHRERAAALVGLGALALGLADQALLELGIGVDLTAVTDVDHAGGQIEVGVELGGRVGLCLGLGLGLGLGLSLRLGVLAGLGLGPLRRVDVDHRRRTLASRPRLLAGDHGRPW
jgi:hypothetical protein